MSARLGSAFLALLNGAALLPLELKEEGLANLGKWLIARRNHRLQLRRHGFPSQLLKVSTGKRKFPKIRLIHIGGEPISKSDVELYKQYFSDHCMFISRFGMSETPTISYYFINKQTETEDDRVPVGYPLEGNEVRLLDDDGKAVGVNGTGEIVVKSPYLAVGYWRQPELTREKFRADPAGGNARIYLTGDLGYLLSRRLPGTHGTKRFSGQDQGPSSGSLGSRDGFAWCRRHQASGCCSARRRRRRGDWSPMSSLKRAGR